MAMAADIERRAPDPHTESLWEDVRTKRAKRRLIEHELTRRRTLLILTVGLTIVGVILALVGEPKAGSDLVGVGVGAALRRSDEHAR
jgi:hypothetical protein